MKRLLRVAAAGVAVLAIGGCTSSAPSSTTPSKAGDGSTANLATKLQSAKLSCADYKDVPQNPTTFSGAGIRDIGNCSLGHLAVFDNAKARDQWTASQVHTVKMRECVTGRTWAVCIFPTNRATETQVQSALKGLTTS